MTVDDPRFASRRVRCPICADEFPWPDDPTISVFDEDDGSYQLIDISSLPPAKQADLVRRGYRQCPNPSEDTDAHYLPATYNDYRDPLVIGLVGAPASGKTHLLTAMIRQAYQGGLNAYGITTSALDFRRHAEFRRLYITPFERGDALPGTVAGIVEAADILLLRGPRGERAVTFFDVAGEDLESTSALNRATRFLVGANAVIFVYAPEDQLETGRPVAASENRSFDLAVERLQGLPGGVAPAAGGDRGDQIGPVAICPPGRSVAAPGQRAHCRRHPDSCREPGCLRLPAPGRGWCVVASIHRVSTLHVAFRLGERR